MLQWISVEHGAWSREWGVRVKRKLRGKVKVRVRGEWGGTRRKCKMKGKSENGKTLVAAFVFSFDGVFEL